MSIYQDGLWWNGAMIFVLFYRWWYGPMVNFFSMVKWWYRRMIWIYQYGFVVKWCNCFCIFLMVKWSNGESICFGRNFVDVDMVKWCCGDMVKQWRKMNSKTNRMARFYCSFVFVSALVSLHFIQYSKNDDPDVYLEDLMYYLKLLLISLIFCLFAFQYSLIYKWYSGDMIPDCGAIMVWQFCSGDSLIRKFYDWLFLGWILFPGKYTSGYFPG